MAVTDLTTLWKLAATYMGETANDVIVDATNPSKPIELTFSTIYTEIRKQMLRQVEPLFARRHEDLLEAPYIDANGNSATWTETFQYTYRKPLTALRFLGFARDRYDLGYVADFKMGRLPIYYTTLSSDSNVSTVFTWNDRTTGVWFRDYAHVELYDNRGVPCRFYEKPTSGATGFDWYCKVNRGSAFAATGSTQPLYLPGTGSGFDLDLGQIGLDFSTSPSSVSIQVAQEAQTESQWTDNIHTDIAPTYARGVYLIDVTDPTEWTEEFQMLVANELARRASIVHAKSTKMIKMLNDERALSMTNAVTQDASEDDNLEDNRRSGAERARA